MLLPGGRKDQHDNGRDGGLSKINFDLEVMDDEELRSQKNSSIFPKLFSCALQVGTLILRGNEVHFEISCIEVDIST